MNRKMTFFAFGAKCPACGAIGFGRAKPAPAPAPKRFFSPSIEASAMPPSPTPQRLKKCRRVSAQGCGAGWEGDWDNMGNQRKMGIRGAFAEGATFRREARFSAPRAALASFASDGFIEIQEHARDGEP